ncbi:MAG: nucleotidyltransferase domain-containing protein, partial [Gemmatimonadaceae bacterium]|nr:nucleotidyltransferase domain-containing protein [Gemmatimonadaceae bacterium]
MAPTLVPTSLPAWHRPFVERVCELFARDTRVLGIAAGGSWLTDTMDEYSDLDFVVVTENDGHASALADAMVFA